MKNKLYNVFLFIMALLIISGCADNINNPSANVSIAITKPTNNDTINFRSNTVEYDVIISGGIQKIDLYINGNLYKSYLPNPDGTKPVINIALDSTYINKGINFQLKYYDYNGFAESPLIHVLVSEEKIVPYKPFGVKILKLSSTTYNIAWQDSSRGNISHEIWRRSDLEQDFSLYINAPGGISNVNDENTSNTRVYYYKIRGCNQYGYSEFSYTNNTLGSGGSTDIPAPKLLSVTVISITVISLKWQDNSINENYFGIERKSSYGDFIFVGVAERNSTTYRDSGTVSAGAEYTYRIKAYSGSDSSWSNEVTIQVPSYVLAAPTLTSITNPTSKKVVLKWKDNDSHYANFFVERRTEPLGSFEEIDEVLGNLTTYEDQTIEINKTYTYRVREYDQTGYSAYSNEMGISTTQIPLTCPSGITLKYLAYYAVEIKWNLIDVNVSKVLIERRLSTEPISAYTEIAEVENYQKSYYDTGTICQKTYIYRLRSTDGTYYSNFSPEYVITNTDICN